MSGSFDRAGGTGRASRRAPFFTAVLILLLLGLLSNPRSASGQLPDAVPTWWHEAAGLTPLLTAPPPPEPATICLIDTGVTPTPDLDITARWAYDGGTLDDIRETPDSPGHGTLVAHFAAGAVNGWGGAGAFPHARISSVRVFPREGGASWREYIAAISRCLKLDASTKVIVISIGGQEIEPGEAEELEHHVEQARDLYDVSVVAAAGNAGGNVDFPARFPAAFAVAASDGSGLCRFSARGPAVDVTAPGCGLLLVGAGGAGWSLDGTSFAAPVAAAVIAALRSYNRGLSAADAEAIVRASARGEDRLLDGGAAFDAAQVALPAATPPAPPAVEAPRAEPPIAPTTESLGAIPPRPRVVVRRRGLAVRLLVRNRPPGARLEVRTGRRRIQRRRSRISVPARYRRVRCRFVLGAVSSRWTAVRW